MARLNINHVMDKGQEKNECFSSLSEINSRSDLISFCSNFTSMVVNSESSPWGCGKNPVMELKKQGVTKLSKDQKSLIMFLNKFFRMEKPVFFKQENLQHFIGMHKDNHLPRLISSLVKRKILIKINWKSGKKGHGYKVMLLPNNPKIDQNLNAESGLLSEENLKVSGLLKSATLICNSPESLKNFASLIQVYKGLHNITSNIKVTFTLTSIYKQTLRTKTVSPSSIPKKSSISFENSFTHREIKSNPKSLETKSMDKLKLKVKEESKPRKEIFVKKETKISLPRYLKECIADLKSKPIKERILTTHEINQLSPYVEKKFGLDLKNLFKNANHFEYPYAWLENKIRLMLLELLDKDIDLDFKNGNTLINQFNKTQNKRFSKTQVKMDSMAYIKTIIGLTYRLTIDEHTPRQVVAAIKRLDAFGNSSSEFIRMKKWSLLSLIADPNEKGTFAKFAEEDEIDFKSNLYSYKSKNPESFKKFTEIFLNVFQNQETGEKNLKRFGSNLALFLDKRIAEIQTQKVDLCGFKLTVPSNGNIPIMQEYFSYLSDSQGKFLCMDITNDIMWKNFIFHKMRGEYGFEKFWVSGIDNGRKRY